jgi:hypothetical protein
LLVEQIPNKTLLGTNLRCALRFTPERGVSNCPRSCLFRAHQNPVFVVASVSKVGFTFGFVPGTFGFVLALVQVHFSGCAAGFGRLLRGLGSNVAVNADGLQPPVTLVR